MPGTTYSGRSPTPVAILEARGSKYAKGRPDEPRPEPAAPECPAWLKGEARREWKRQAVALVEMCVLATVDLGLLASWCESWGAFVKLCKDAKAPYAAKSKVIDQLVKLSDRLGFSPSARARVRVESKPKGDDEKGRFFAAGKVG